MHAQLRDKPHILGTRAQHILPDMLFVGHGTCQVCPKISQGCSNSLLRKCTCPKCTWGLRPKQETPSQMQALSALLAEQLCLLVWGVREELQQRQDTTRKNVKGAGQTNTTSVTCDQDWECIPKYADLGGATSRPARDRMQQEPEDTLQKALARIAGEDHSLHARVASAFLYFAW